MKSRRAAAIAAAALLTLVLAAAALNTRLAVNLWLLATDSEYIVPSQSHLASFVPTLMNPGSGGWWLYGEDQDHYYHFVGAGLPPYRYISRAAAGNCPGFDRHRHESWCA